MKNNNLIKFMERCVNAGCVVAPIKLYFDYGHDGEIDESFFKGVFYVAFEYDVAVGPKYFSMIDHMAIGRGAYHKTPEEALEAWLKQ